MTRAKRNGLFLVLLSGAFSLTWGLIISRGVPGGVLDLQGVYYGSQCLLHNCDPYNTGELDAFYKKLGVDDPTESLQRHQVKVLYVNLPTTFLFIAPLSLLPWKAAAIIWVGLITVTLLLATLLMWDIGAAYSTGLSTLIACILLANSEVVFATGNTAGLVVSLTVIGTWCFVRQRFVAIGILCLAAALAIKPHDAGLVWLFFIFAGPMYRRWALRSFVITAILGVIAFTWVSCAVPNWMPEILKNLSTISGPHGLNAPGPNTATSNSAAMVIDLQAAVSVFSDRPAVYNTVSYVICGTMLNLWCIKTLRSQLSQSAVWLGLATIVPLTILVTYHRPYDAKLLLLCVPACCSLWSQGHKACKLAAVLTAASATLTGDIPLAMSVVIYRSLASSFGGPAQKLLTLFLTQPAPLTLLAVAVFYLWAYIQLNPSSTSLPPSGNRIAVTGGTVTAR